jgi:HAD superfamily hydrolase (TIGR01509 family)
VNKIRLIIFDCDGVLVDSEPIMNSVYPEILTACGYSISPDRFMDRFCGMSDAETFKIIEEEWGQPLPDDFETRVAKLLDARCEMSLGVTPGVVDALGQLSMPICVASSGVPERIRNSLRIAHLLDRFEPNLFSATMVGRGKPAPDLFLYAASKMGVEPSRCVVVEDSVAGVQAGVAARMTVIGFCGGGHCRPNHPNVLRRYGAIATISDMRELLPTLATI